MLKPKVQFSKGAEVFNDGIINVLNACDGVVTSNRISNVKFGERTVGIKRYYEAQTVGHKIEGVISIPFGVDVTTDDLLEVKAYHLHSTVKSGIYSISQIQHPVGKVPDCLYISLMKGSIEYDDGRAI